MEGIFVGMLAVLGIFVISPIALFTFLHHNKKMKVDLQKLEQQKNILALELKKEELIIERMSLENRMLDRKIEQIDRKV
jgi:ABC-type protease/lipase transport system fused ATPase/permease subunit